MQRGRLIHRAPLFARDIISRLQQMERGRAVHALAEAADGSLYVGGDFSTAGGLTVNGIARWNGSVWSALGTGLAGGYAAAVAARGSDVFVGGWFPHAGANAGPNFARWNGTSWVNHGGPNGPVFAVQATPYMHVYVAGAFDTIAGQTRLNSAVWTGSTWLSWGNFNGPVYTLLLAPNNDLYAGGEFTSVNGVTANHVVWYNAYHGTWNPLGTGANNGVNGAVYALHLKTDGTLYVGGEFSFANGNSISPNVATWNSTTGWQWVGYGADGVVMALEAGVSTDHTLVGGEFTAVHDGSEFLPAGRLAVWRPDGLGWGDWDPLGAPFSGPVLSLLKGTQYLHAGGEFQSAGGMLAPGLARWKD